MAKLGQLAAYEPHVDAAGASPEARAKLAQLWDHAPSISAAEIGRVVEAELGKPPQAAFARWDPTPLAAASLGQVHAATSHDGAEYAVKVQYPGIADALRADLASAGFARKLAGIEHLTDDAIAALRAAVLGELDYTREAAALERFATAWRDDPAIRIPRVDRARSTARVLTMERARGTPWPRGLCALPRSTQQRRAHRRALRLRLAARPRPLQRRSQPGQLPRRRRPGLVPRLRLHDRALARRRRRRARSLVGPYRFRRLRRRRALPHRAPAARPPPPRRLALHRRAPRMGSAPRGAARRHLHLVTGLRRRARDVLPARPLHRRPHAPRLDVPALAPAPRHRGRPRHALPIPLPPSAPPRARRHRPQSALTSPPGPAIAWGSAPRS